MWHLFIIDKIQNKIVGYKKLTSKERVYNAREILYSNDIQDFQDREYTKQFYHIIIDEDMFIKNEFTYNMVSKDSISYPLIYDELFVLINIDKNKEYNILDELKIASKNVLEQIAIYYIQNQTNYTSKPSSYKGLVLFNNESKFYEPCWLSRDIFNLLYEKTLWFKNYKWNFSIIDEKRKVHFSYENVNFVSMQKSKFLKFVYDCFIKYCDRYYQYTYFWYGDNKSKFLGKLIKNNIPEDYKRFLGEENISSKQKWIIDVWEDERKEDVYHEWVYADSKEEAIKKFREDNYYAEIASVRKA